MQYRETFDDGPGGWYGWRSNEAGPKSLEINQGYALSRSPWWIDYNHAPPGAGYMHLLYMLNTMGKAGEYQREVEGENRFIAGAFPTDFRQAQMTLTLKGELIDAGFLKQLGFFSGPAGPWYAWPLAAGLGLGYAYLTAQKIPLIKERWLELSWFNLVGVYAAVSAAVIEEAVFRRVLMDQVFGGSSVPLQILLSGALFGVAHGVWGLLKGSWHIAWEATKATTGLGLLLAGLYVLSDRSLAPCITAHFILTALIEPWLLVGVMTRPQHPPPDAEIPA